MTMYRIQSKQNKRRGAYRSHTLRSPCSDIVCKMLDEHGNTTMHPNPKQDVGRLIELDEHCGFNSAAKLLRWFRGFIPDLLRAGYEIVALQDMTVTAVGEYQVLFKFPEDVCNTEAYGTTRTVTSIEQLASIEDIAF